VERYVQPARAVHHPAHAFQIQIAVRRQRADHDAVRTEVPVHPDLLAHLLQFFLAVKKIAEARADQDVGLDRDIALHLPEQRGRRRRPTDDEMRA